MFVLPGEPGNPFVWEFTCGKTFDGKLFAECVAASFPYGMSRPTDDGFSAGMLGPPCIAPGDDSPSL